MKEKIFFLKRIALEILNFLFVVYIIYIVFLYLWSTFEYIVPKAAFILALILTTLVVGAYGWYKYYQFKKL